MNKRIPDIKIDVVIPWVDGNDPYWQSLFNQYTGVSSADKSKSRYRDWDNMQYVLRGIENFCPLHHSAQSLKIKPLINQALYTILPNKSSFEI